MKAVSIELLPAIRHILGKCEDELKALTGIPIYVKLAVGPTEINEVVIQSLVCSAFNVTWNQIVGSSREMKVKTARFVYIWLSITWLKKTLVQLGNELGGRDHSTIIHARDAVKKLLDNNDIFLTQKINDIEKQLQQL